MIALDVERGSRLAAHIAKAIRGSSADEDHAVLCWTLARLGRSAGIPKQEYVGRVLSDLDAARKYQDRHKVPPVRWPPPGPMEGE